MLEVETKSASLDTLSVTIQALHVNGKQMTLAVFRQLPSCGLYVDCGIDPALHLWGIVRYPIKDEGSLWAVADRDGRLYRCDVDRIGEPSDWISNRLTQGRNRLDWFHAFIAHEKKERSWQEAGGWKADPQMNNRPKHLAVPFDTSEWRKDPDKARVELLYEIEDDERRLKNALSREAARMSVLSIPQLFIAV